MDINQKLLIQGIKNKNMKQYEKMVDCYTKVVYSVVYQILHGILTKEDIEECVADVFVDAWYKIGEYKEEKGNFRTWLLILAKYKALTYKRKMSKYKCNELMEESLISTENVEANYLEREEQQRIIETIDSFQEVDKQIFYSRYFYGEKITDLAKKFNLSRSAIDNRLFRGRKILKEVLEDG